MAGLDKIISQIKKNPRKRQPAPWQGPGMRQIRSWQLPVRKRKASAPTLKGVPGSPLPTSWKRGQSAADLKKRGSILAEKQKLIGDTIEKAKAELKGMDTDAYFDMILKLAVKSAQNGKGELLFSAKDLARVPEGFEDRLNAALKDKDAALHISKDTRDIDAGFVLTYGGIEENCSINAIFDSAHELLQDKVQEILFS